MSSSKSLFDFVFFTTLNSGKNPRTDSVFFYEDGLTFNLFYDSVCREFRASYIFIHKRFCLL